MCLLGMKTVSFGSENKTIPGAISHGGEGSAPDTIMTHRASLRYLSTQSKWPTKCIGTDVRLTSGESLRRWSSWVSSQGADKMADQVACSISIATTCFGIDTEPSCYVHAVKKQIAHQINGNSLRVGNTVFVCVVRLPCEHVFNKHIWYYLSNAFTVNKNMCDLLLRVIHQQAAEYPLGMLARVIFPCL